MAGAEELARYMLICLTFLAAALVTLDGGQIRMEEFQAALPERPRWLLQLVIEISGVLFFAYLAAAGAITIARNINTRTAVTEIPFLLFMGPLALGAGAAGAREPLAAQDHLDPGPSRPEADHAHLRSTMQGFLVIFAFVGLFVLGFPVVLAIGIPCAIYLVPTISRSTSWPSARSTRSIPSRLSRFRCSCSSAA